MRLTVWKIETVLALGRLAGEPLPGGGIDSVAKPITLGWAPWAVPVQTAPDCDGSAGAQVSSCHMLRVAAFRVSVVLNCSVELVLKNCFLQLCIMYSNCAPALKECLEEHCLLETSLHSYIFWKVHCCLDKIQFLFKMMNVYEFNQGVFTQRWLCYNGWVLNSLCPDA